MMPKKPDDIAREDWDAVDVPEMTDAEFARARPFQEVFPAQFETWQRDVDARNSNSQRCT